MDIESLCLEIAMVEDGNQVIQILKGNNLWEDEDCWALVGSKPGEDYEGNNHATIGNQQSNPSNALVEKLDNCGDSALLLKCFEKGIDPKSADAPDNVRDDIEKFFNVRGGRWINAPDKDRTLLGKKFCNLVATGEKGRNSNPTLTIIDSAEGQHPNDFYKTFMSLTLKNKVGIKFVQGKFGMGSFGAVNFCTVDGLQLIISKRNPKLIEDDKNNPFGFTVVRKIEPEGNYKSSRWVYLVIDGKIPSFERDYLDLMPGKHPDPYGGKFEYGSFIKLYNYDMGPGLRSNIELDLYNKINTLQINPVVPVRFYERRQFKGHSYETTLDGLETRLDRDRTGVLAEGYPTEFLFNVEGQKFKATVYAFKKYSNEEKKKKVRTGNYGNGVMFVINGQTNGNLPTRFFSAKRLKYENISNNILVLVDCSEVEPKYVEKLFQNNRERIFENSFTEQIKENLRDHLNDHEGLKTFQNDW